MRWTNATAVDKQQLTPCDRCLTVAEQQPAIGKRVHLAPAARTGADVLPGRVVEPMQPNSALDRLGRRIAFRDRVGWPDAQPEERQTGRVELSESAVDYLDEQMRRIYDRELLALTADVFRAPAPDDEQARVEDPDRPLAYSSTS